ncbi:acyltransferase [Methanobrevibacter sp.]|uniref:acyltransferase n=1 Tax=Methanobrevibacter sp. TaxID=66852 RepID=UPI00388D3A40
MNVKKQRIIYLDYLKVLAIFSIIAMHITSFFSQVEMLNIQLHLISQIGRFAVPIFLMVSGVLLINRDYPSFKDFFVPKTVKITLPYIFWVIVIILLSFYYNNVTSLDFNAFSIMFNSFFSFGILWYFWMMIGVYLAIPIINEYVKNKGLEGIRYFLIIAVIASVIYQCCNIFQIETYLDFRFFIGPIFYILLGYYLHNRDFGISANRMILICAVMFIALSVVKTSLNVIPSNVTIFYALNNHSFNAGANVFLNSFLDVGIIEVLHASSLFLLLKYLSLETLTGIASYIKRIVFSKPLSRIGTSISRSTWGIYCSHAIFLIILPGYLTDVHLSGTNTAILILALSLGVLIIGHVITLALSKIPYLDKISGYS